MSEESTQEVSTTEPQETVESQETTQEVEQLEKKEEPSKEEVKQAMLKKFKLKVDGEEFEEEIDLNDEAYITKQLQLAKAAKKRMEEAQQEKRKAYEIAQMLEKDPTALLKKMGDKGYEYAEQLLLEKIQKEMMTPEQRELSELKERLARFERQEKESLERQEQEKQSALENKIAQEYQQKIISALEKTGLPKTPDMAKRMAFLLQKNLEIGLDLDADDLAEEAKKEVMGLFSSLAKDADAEKLLNIIGKDNYKKIDKFRVQELKKKQLNNFGVKSPTQVAQPQFKKGRSYQTFEEWQEEVNRNLKSND